MINRIIVLVLTALLLTSCSAQTLSDSLGEKLLSDPQSFVSEPYDTPDAPTLPHSYDNPIDRAFARVAADRPELEGNTAFAYLYAKKWWEEHFAVAELLFYDGRAENHKKSVWDYDKKQRENAVVYANQWSATADAANVFMEMGCYFKLLTLHSLDRVKRSAEIQTNEEKLYQLLLGYEYDVFVPDEFNSEYFIERSTAYPLPVMAAVPEKDIRLAYAYPFGEVISRGNRDSFYALYGEGLLPRMTFPTMAAFDYDGDNQEEIAVVIPTGSGTGVSVSELFIVRADHSYTRITSDNITEWLYHRLSASYDYETDMLTVKLDEQEVKYNISLLDASFTETNAGFRAFDLHSIIYFDLTAAGISVKIGAGLCGFDQVSPFEYVDIYADMQFNGTEPLTNCRIEPPEAALLPRA